MSHPDDTHMHDACAHIRKDLLIGRQDPRNKDTVMTAPNAEEGIVRYAVYGTDLEPECEEHTLEVVRYEDHVAEVAKIVSDADARWYRTFDGHVYVKSDEYSGLVRERDALARRVGEAMTLLRRAQHIMKYWGGPEPGSCGNYRNEVDAFLAGEGGV